MSIINKVLNMWREGSMMDEVCMRIWNWWVNVKLVLKNGRRICWKGKECCVKCGWNNKGICEVDEDEVLRDIWWNKRKGYE